MRVFKILILYVAFLLMSCQKKSDSPPPVVAQVYCENGELKEVGIFGGKVLNEDAWLAKGLVLVLTESGNGMMSICTGSLIDNNIVLTAGHCVDKSEMAYFTRVAFSIEPICNIESGRKDLLKDANAIHRHHQYDDEDLKNDLAMIRFQGTAPAGFHALPLAFESIQIQSGQKVFVSGYGKETDYHSDEDMKIRLKVAEVKAYQKPEESLKSLNNEEGILLDQTSGQGACAGDSGGPALVKVDGTLKVVGVASYITDFDKKFEYSSEATCKKGVVYSSVRYFKKWILENYHSLKDENSIGSLLQ